MFSAKCFLVSVWLTTWERASAWFKSCLLTAGKGSGRSFDTRGMTKGPLQKKATGLQRLLVVFEGEPFQETLIQPNLRAGQPVRLVRWLPTFLMSFPSSSRNRLSRESERWEQIDQAHEELKLQRAVCFCLFWLSLYHQHVELYLARIRYVINVNKYLLNK